MTTLSLDHLKALVVEDNAHMRILLRSLLQALGIATVYESVDGASGFIELRERKPDFVLTDLSMKPVDGIEFTRRIRLGRDSPNPYMPDHHGDGPHGTRTRGSGARCRRDRISREADHDAEPLVRLIEVVERPRPFIRCEGYFGPDRRRHKAEDYAGPWRRRDDVNDDDLVIA